MNSSLYFFRHYSLAALFSLFFFACSPRVSSDAILRVGTTGDYPPLTSFDTLTGKFSGEDIDMAIRLGHHLGRKVIFVRTTWKTLAEDMLAGKFDLTTGFRQCDKGKAV